MEPSLSLTNSTVMPRLFFNLDISPDEYQYFYKGIKKFIVTHTEDGQRLQFPASELRTFVSHTGVQGRFEITFSGDYRLLSLKRLN